jgi:hypothetical protein
MGQKINYLQVVEQSHEEKMKMYMKFQKKKLAEMLIECNNIISKLYTYTTSFPPVKKHWVCNECGNANFTESIPEIEIEQKLHSCIYCGGLEFHLEEVK